MRCSEVTRKGSRRDVSMVGHVGCLRESVRLCPVRHLAVPTSTSSFTWKYEDQGDEIQTIFGAVKFCIKARSYRIKLGQAGSIMRGRFTYRGRSRS